MNQHTVVDYSK